MTRVHGWLCCVLAVVFWVSPVMAQSARVKPGAVIYGVVPPLFGREPFRDVTRKLDYLKAQGVDILWISPLNQTDDIGILNYSVTDHFKHREDFGSEEDLRELVREAKVRGLRVLMDFVPNHTSSAHPYALDCSERGKASPYYTYYERDAAGEPVYYFDWENLFNLNFSHPQVVKFVSDAFVHWLRSFGFSGYRVDVAWGVEQRAPSFWAKMNAKLRKIDPEAIMLAEASAVDDVYYKKGFDLAYDWTKELGVWSWREAFENPSRTGELLRESLKAHPRPQQVVRFLNNNDTGKRFLTRYGIQRTRVAAVFQHTVPGIPIVYTGDEIGAEYEPYEDPPALDWSDKNDLASLYRRLAELRESEPALRDGAYLSAEVSTTAAHAFLRKASDKEWVLVVLNFGKKSTLNLNLPFDACVSATCTWTDLLTGGEVKTSRSEKSLKIEMPARHAWILKAN